MDTVIVGGLGIVIVLVAVLTFLLVQTLNATRKSVEGAKDVMSERALQTMGEINELDKALQTITQQQEEAQQIGRSLRDLLESPRLRGSYGEIVLEEMLERILPRGIWERQYTMEGGERVDCVVRFRDAVVPIDAKFPRDAYMRYLEAEAEEEKAGHWRDFESAVRVQIASIKEKYIKPEQGTTEFALMFIPSEAIYYETIAERNYLGQPSSLLTYAQEHQVFPVSPNTFYAFLQVVILAFRRVEVIEAAERLRQGLAELQRSFQFFYDRYQDIGRGIERAAEAYRVGEGHVGRFKQRLDATLQLEGPEIGESHEEPAVAPLLPLLPESANDEPEEQP